MVFWNETEASEMFLFLWFLRGMFINLLPYLGLQSNQISKRLWILYLPVLLLYSLKIIFQNTCRSKSFLPYNWWDQLNRSQTDPKSFISFCCWDCNDFCIGTEHLKYVTKYDHSSAIAQGPEEMCLSLELQNPSKTSEKMGYFDRVTVSSHR